MRLPRDKIWRAFPALDAFSDEQCRIFVERAGNEYRSAKMAVIGGTIAAMGVVLPIGFALLNALWGLLERRLQQSRGEYATRDLQGLVVFGIVMLLLFCGCIAVLVARDRWLIWTITRRIRQAACQGCGYSLLGLTPMAGVVMCPECNQPYDLLAAGMTEADLLARP